MARDLYHFCVPGGTLDVSPTQKWQRSLATPERSLKDPWPHVKKPSKKPSNRNISRVAKDLSRIFGDLLGIFTTFALCEGPMTCPQHKSGKDPSPHPKDP